MNRIILFAVFILCSTGIFAQFAVVNDKDGYVIVRSSPKIEQDNIIDTLHNGRFIYVENMKNKSAENWIGIVVKDFYYGYIDANNIKQISEYQHIEYISENENKLTFRDSNISVEIKIREFDKSKHKIKYYKKNVHLIDEKIFFGTDGNLPKYEYEYINITMNETTYFLPNEATENLYEPNFNHFISNSEYILFVSPFYDKENDILYIQSMNGDGAGGYTVVWKIEKGIYKERMVRSFYGPVIQF